MRLQIKYKNIYMEFEWDGADQVERSAGAADALIALDELADTPVDKMDEEFVQRVAVIAVALYIFGGPHVTKIED